MTNIAFFPFLLLFLLLTACASEVPTENHDTEVIPRNEALPIITNVETNFPEKEGWIIIPTDSTELNVTVEATNAETLLFWAVPTGTETWGKRELIGYDTNGNDGWKITWNIAGKSLHHHMTVQALGSDGNTITDETIKITNE
ncbi:hypothetical protein [Paenibacillus sp. OK003]|uniref:hypothetical protein n=1 Tax=Paenibacillus sp. OK003 TaxID=1884380 RepID=UPI0008C0EC03|nr:hypothetical protein [Paenibacillus sp. OK003]SEL10579.1 hypothetical protein SAMN05518856_107336 [Paenibacillus sp. OK003]